MYSKPALDISALVERLQNKGLRISNTQHATNSLRRIGYYRLLIYMRPFQDAQKQFTSNCDFRHIVQLYEFDRELRLLCLDAIERAEVALRAAIINSLTVRYGPHFYTDANHYSKPKYHQTFLERVAEAESLAISHYKANYSSPAEPPLWAVLEAITMGTLSKFFADLTRANRTLIAQNFSHSESVLVSWFRCISVFRNKCAHHNRIWNAKITVNKPIVPHSLAGVFSDIDSFHARAIILFCLLREVEPAVATEWRDRLHNLFARYTAVVDPLKLGFSTNDPFWSL
jgi:abortive infection bacteriophage resistance protein